MKQINYNNLAKQINKKLIKFKKKSPDNVQVQVVYKPDNTCFYQVHWFNAHDNGDMVLACGSTLNTAIKDFWKQVGDM